MTTGRHRKIWALCLSFAMVFSIIPSQIIPSPTVKAADYGIGNPRIDKKNGVVTVTWDSIYFGNYWQNDTNGDGVPDKHDDKEPIRWRVLSVKGDDAFLLADTNLDTQVYNGVDADEPELTDVTWETCIMRSWLNSDFYNAAFSDAEKSAIKTTTVVNEDHPSYGTEGGNNTNDKVYLLSIQEAMNSSYGFLSSDYSSKTRVSVNTEYLGELNKYMMTAGSAGDSDFWWLRSLGYNSDYAAIVGETGYVNPFGIYVYSIGSAVRPVLHLNLSSDEWSKADAVVVSESEESGSGATETEKPTASPKPAKEPTVTPELTIEPTNRPAKVTAPEGVKKLTAKNNKKKAVALSWKKVSGAKGYQIQYAFNKKFTKKKKSRLTKKRKFTVKKLKKKKTYYFRVRAYKLNGNKKVYGKWSKVKKIKVKK